jgi:hypothetical protein
VARVARVKRQYAGLIAPLFHDTDHEATISRLCIPGDVHFNPNGARLIASECLARWRPDGAGPP